jgi:hypothetical protein
MSKATAKDRIEQGSELESQGCDFEEHGKFELAFEFYLKAAKLGCVGAQVNLGNFYDDGKGCQRSSKKAIYWYKRAYNLGCSYGAFNLGVHYRQHGKHRWAKFWLKRAADMGHEDALFEFVNYPRSS